MKNTAFTKRDGDAARDPAQGAPRVDEPGALDSGGVAGAGGGSRPEMITAGLILLLNAYRCRSCQHLANCIVSHCRSLRAHPDADPMLRQLAAHLETEWCPLAMPAPLRKNH